MILVVPCIYVAAAIGKTQYEGHGTQGYAQRNGVQIGVHGETSPMRADAAM